ncbi:MoaD/ThiS family protein [Saccharothrix obliqua]|uniref:MoaD/ThiS family protein n=1 Tax=Saccharothrix obliqua TaxID=2861747 RepID=UPI001C5E76B5|nr:MoaD/ThiS family protein [Saccharothrix obliqua]MBW4720697.1 MoaD/ThiS family protein [Saccharothrix obliqua]
MRVVVLVPGVLRSAAGGRAVVDLDLAEPATLGTALDALTASWPLLDRRLRDERGVLRRYVNFYVDGEECRRLAGVDTRLEPGAEIRVLPSVAGG